MSDSGASKDPKNTGGTHRAKVEEPRRGLRTFDTAGVDLEELPGAAQHRPADSLFGPAPGSLLQRQPSPPGRAGAGHGLPLAAPRPAFPGRSFAAIPTHAVQRKLAVGPADDHLEQEADRVAEQVVGSGAPALQRTPT